ncbi:hypothetical protein DSCW_20500 [Desulfosarcina widdelii]|uniref:TIR domain-containing protein n=1 Tax=Desulfosarcina widdelii TaxID=947919 RepID=A0A5K7Z3U3_9BACT|nr:toll/interleukin-1 receptor domain-containing protein [Desulfosarcina widdelii]BBO74633.1 hypothetical protein DSCW_20500 [Desulfosarcina widdelii]
MPVFISHRSIDTERALTVHQYLTNRGVKCYIDKLDDALQSTDDITNVILKRISQCSHMMAVASEYTQGSWWVPFELGVATESDRRISSYKATNVNLPQYLSKWPILSSQYDLNKFIENYKRDNSVAFSESRATYQDIKSADQFHRRLKIDIGQR